MLNIGDGEIQALFVAGGLKAPEVNCASGHRIERFCCNPSCSTDAVCCNQDDCEYCQCRHEYCSFVHLKKLIKHADGLLFEVKKAVSDILKAENELIIELNKSRKALIDMIRSWKPEERCSSTIGSFFYNSNTKGLKGKHVKEYMSIIQENSKESEAKECLQEFKKKGGELMNNLIALREGVVHKFISKKINPKIDSNILLQDKQGREKAAYLLKQLGSPSKLKLLFRASQNSFSAVKFHQICDKISNTVTIIRTEFHKTIAAYTPLKWQASDKYSYVADPSLSSFILQLELKEKLILIKEHEQYAIINHRNRGPMFGRGKDIFIADRCCQKSQSYWFPDSYNCGEKYIESQESFTAFSGATDGFHFRVVDYEVFEVIK